MKLIPATLILLVSGLAIAQSSSPSANGSEPKLSPPSQDTLWLMEALESDRVHLDGPLSYRVHSEVALGEHMLQALPRDEGGKLAPNVYVNSAGGVVTTDVCDYAVHPAGSFEAFVDSRGFPLVQKRFASGPALRFLFEDGLLLTAREDNKKLSVTECGMSAADRENLPQSLRLVSEVALLPRRVLAQVAVPESRLELIPPASADPELRIYLLELAVPCGDFTSDVPMTRTMKLEMRTLPAFPRLKSLELYGGREEGDAKLLRRIEILVDPKEPGVSLRSSWYPPDDPVHPWTVSVSKLRLLDSSKSHLLDGSLAELKDKLVTAGYTEVIQRPGRR